MRTLMLALLLVLLPGSVMADEEQDVEIEVLIEQLGDRSWKKREKASARLAEIGDAAVPALKEAAKSEVLEIRWRARKLLIKLGALVDPKVLEQVKQLVAVAVDESKPLAQRTKARKDIVELGDQALAAFFHVLHEKDYRMRRHVTELARDFSSNKQVVPLLLKALEDSEGLVSSGAARSLRTLTGQKFASYDKKAWRAWWEANKKGWKPRVDVQPKDPGEKK